MPTITFDKFNRGLDRRRGRAVADADRLWVCKNAYITRGNVIRKRPGISLDITLPTSTAGTSSIGLASGYGKLHVFHHQEEISIPNTKYKCLRATHKTTNATQLSVMEHAESFYGYMYASLTYTDSSTYHHYFDADGLTEWQASTAYSVGDYAKPTAGNETGLRYKVLSITGGGVSGASEPTWPTAVPITVVDNEVTWQAVSTAVEDANCPNSKSFTKQASKIFAPDGDVVRFTASAATGTSPDARDWTTASDAGFLPTGINSKGASDALAVGQYQDNLAVFMSDAFQIWSTDPDPANIVLSKALEGIGSSWPESIVNFQGDLVFAAKQGVRSIVTQSTNENLEEQDVGSPIDDIIDGFNAGERILSAYVPTTGQYWLLRPSSPDTKAYVYTFSRGNKIRAWSEYVFSGIVISDIAVLDGNLYLRSGNNVYIVDPASQAATDNGVVYPMLVEMPYLTFNRPGSMKYIRGFDMVVSGDPGAVIDVSFKYDPNDSSLETNKVSYTIPASGILDTRVQQQIPLEITTAAISPVFSNNDDKNIQIDMIQFHYDELGLV